MFVYISYFSKSNLITKDNSVPFHEAHSLLPAGYFHPED